MQSPRFQDVIDDGISPEDLSDEPVSTVASQWRLMWWRFRKNRLAVGSAIILLGFYGLFIFAEFLGTGEPSRVSQEYHYLRPQPVRFFDEGTFRLHMNGIEGYRDENFKKEYRQNPDVRYSIGFFTRGYPYKFLGLVPFDRHLVGFTDPQVYEKRPALFLLGSDKLGRDQLSRLFLATRISLSIGLVGVILSLILGVTIGGVSGYFGGRIDIVIQRIIEVLIGIPTLPLWMALSAAVPLSWSVLQVYLAITAVLSIFSWTGTARVVRGKFLALREEEFVMAAKLMGATELRIIFRHMLPSFYSHIIAAATLAVPGMILGETALSFLGLGLRPPAVSYGVMLQQAQNVETIAIYPWLMVVVFPVMVVVLAFNFLGDGLRDAADPYG